MKVDDLQNIIKEYDRVSIFCGDDCVYTGISKNIKKELKNFEVENIQANNGLFCLELEIYIIDSEKIKTHWQLLENGGEYCGDIFVKSKEIPKLKKFDYNKYEMMVDGVVISFDEEIKLIKII